MPQKTDFPVDFQRFANFVEKRFFKIRCKEGTSVTFVNLNEKRLACLII